ncbi:trafficking kinesin-binding protein milt isoform X2 [Arctopsyche grandis]
MTKTYNDIEAVTRLLEEKEKDLELTARIGKELLTHNTKLEANVQSLEAELRAAKDELTQLSHLVIKKTELIQVLTNEVDDSSSENGGGTVRGAVSMELLRRRIGGLEDENRSLRAEASRLTLDTDAVEEREARLVRDVAAQLASASMEVDGIEDELSRTKEECQQQKDLLDTTMSKLQITEQKLQQMTVEHEQAIALLDITRENQNSLASELADFKDRYAEVLSLLHDTQEQLRQQRKRVQPMVRGGVPPHMSHIMPHIATAAGLSQHDSLQSELLETSLYSDLSMDSGIGDRVQPFKKVFETVKCASRAQAAGMERAGKGMSGTLPGSTGAWLSQNPMQTVSMSGPRMSTCSSDSAMDNASVTSSFGDPEDTYPGGSSVGIPGVPGAADLEAALRRLTPAEIKARRAKLTAGQHFNHYDYDGRSSPISSLPFGLRTPDSIMSTGVVSSIGRSAAFGGSGTTSWRLPDRLQIVKPMEGSHTLHHWAQLATPTMSGLLEDRPGVQIRGGRGVGDLGLPIYSLNDVEEDDEFPGKRFDNSNLIFTYTNSMVMHPDDGSMAGSMAGSVAGSMRGSVAGSLGGSMWGSALGSEVCSEVPSRMPSARHSPCHTPRATLSRRNSTCTFSTNMGLANILNERGIKAVTPSCVATPAIAWSPTATPCNSPQLGSPLSTPPSSPPPEYSDSPLHPLPPLQSLINSGADILRRTFSPLPAHSQKSSRTDRKNRIVDKVERIGINSLMGVCSSPLSLQTTGGIYMRRGQQSPMAQLTCLKQTLQQGRANALSDVAEHPAESAAPPLGVPGQPGSGAIKAQIDRAQRRPRPRGDLGTVNTMRPDLGTVGSPNKQSGQTFSTLGTLSSLLFGRKGGLL